MKTVVIKRDGCQVNFDLPRIQEAVRRAAAAVDVKDDDYCLQVATVVSEQLCHREKVDIAEIQDAVENQLMSGPYKIWHVPILNIVMIEIANAKSAAN